MRQTDRNRERKNFFPWPLFFPFVSPPIPIYWDGNDGTAFHIT